MKYMIGGGLGTLGVLGMLALGAMVGWRGREAWGQHTSRAADAEISERERRQAEAMDRAMGNMLSYSPEVAYGTDRAAGWEGSE